MDETVATTTDISGIVTLLETGVDGVFGIASNAFGFLMENPLCAFMVCVGFAYSAMSLIRKAIRTAKRT